MAETRDDDALVGQVIASQFRVLKKLGEGGMGAVFLAEQIEMDRKVVVKVLHADMTANNPVAIERFRREAKAVAQLNHPNIVQVFVFGQADGGQMYLAMEYIEGRDLSVDLAEGPMAQPRALRILDQCCAALIEAHGAGIVHRDLKPENIMLADRHGNPDYVKVLDFGIAKLHDGGGKNPTLTQAGSVFGTPRYMSPEQVKGELVDARSDIYALGLILYEMLVGRHPFAATTTIDYLLKHVNEPVSAPSAEGLEIQPRIEALLLKCLEKDPTDRYQSVAELQRDVRVALRDFSEAVRGFPSGQVGALAGADARSSSAFRGAGGRAEGVAVPRPTQGTQPPGRDTYHPPGSRPGSRGVSPWVWALVAFLVVGGIVGVVLAIGPSVGGGGGQALLGGGAGEPSEPVVEAPEREPAGEADAAREQAETQLAKVDPDEEPDATPSAEPAAAPTTTLEAGEAIDGFPVPKDARLTASTTQAEVFETEITPKDAIAFFKAKLHGKYTVSDVPNGIAIAEQESPFSYVTFSPFGDRYYMMLARNALAPRPDKPKGPPPPAFGVEFPDDASLIMKSEQATAMRSRLGFANVCDFYDKKYGGIKGVMVMRNDEGATKSCTIAAAMAQDTPWMAIAIVEDPTSAGAVMISVVPRTSP